MDHLQVLNSHNHVQNNNKKQNKGQNRASIYHIQSKHFQAGLEMFEEIKMWLFVVVYFPVYHLTSS